ncbi:signal transduction histidine kinase/CheY-like chemotaxis protein [Haloferula luteola]|uniref:histidine kinase n=1 Tax=Haloferula luteola TaxID=595692 RepID=A0A840UXJ9_9BACT|nr:ATP-binding protein [Haloferula luteola]MBB5350887.1 signal transduction histidine kinase/CheY-like chemotaxis protein [Haloferula luteola]
MSDIHPLLLRQLRRLPQLDLDSHPDLQRLVTVVGKTYEDFQTQHQFLSHTLETASEELTEANERLRQESESRIRDLSKLFEETLNEQPNIIFRCARHEDAFQVHLARGRRLIARLGWNHNRLEKETIAMLIEDPRHSIHFLRAWKGEEQRFEIDFWHANIVCEVILLPIRENHKVKEIMGVMADITRQKAAEDRLRHASDDLTRRAEELEKNRRVMLSMIEDLDQSRTRITQERDRANALADEAASANRAKSDFLATMSHEIRTPMNGVLGFAQLLQQTILSDQQQDFVSAIRTSAEALLRVINDVLDFSKIESGHMEIEDHPFCLQTSVDDALGTVSTAAAEKGIDLAARFEPNVPTSITGDSHRLRQVLVNLVGNAVKFTPHGEVRLEISANKPDATGEIELTFRISDSGIGIPADQIGKLFTPFHQQDSSTSRRFGGTGLGLAICRRLVELMGGTIRADSTPDVGSVFTFTLRTRKAEDLPDLIQPVPHPGLTGLAALILDTHGWSRSVLAELLERWGMSVRVASTVSEARSSLLEGPISTALVDQGSAETPEGIEFVRELAESGTPPLILCPPGDLVAERDRFGDAISGTVSKPLKVSPFFNLLIKKTAKDWVPTPEVQPAASPAEKEQFELRLLLAEDNPINRKLALAALAQIGCTPDIAVDGQEALDAAVRERYDIILMDVQMPGMDGLEATRRIREWEADHQVPPAKIIALTANALSGDRDLCLKAGMNDYLPKPIKIHSLRDMIRSNSRPDAAPFQETPESQATRTLRQLAQELTVEDAVTLAAEFNQDLEAQIDSIRHSLDLRNDEDARRHAHSLKGSSSIFGLEDLRHAAAAVEKACADRDLNLANQLMPDLQKVAQTASRELHDAVQALGVNTVIFPMS